MNSEKEGIREMGEGERDEYLTVWAIADPTRIFFHSPLIFSTDAVQIRLEPVKN